jgi:hypothetical protein
LYTFEFGFVTWFCKHQLYKLSSFERFNDLLCLTPLSAISWRPVLVVEEPEYPERTTDHGQETGKLFTCGCKSSAPFFVIYKAGREVTPYW